VTFLIFERPPEK